jgi:hypothetical protein
MYRGGLIMVGKTNVKVKPNERIKIDYIEYIQSTGTQYIDTEYFPKENTQFEIDLKDINSSSYESYFGSTYPRLFRSTSSRLELYSISGGNAFSCSLTNRRTLIINNTGVYDENMNLLSSSGKTYTFSGDTKPILIFLSRYNGNPDKYGIYYLYSFKIYENNELKHDFKPCKDSNGTICMYDKIEKKYYYNKGTGSFIGGASI